MLMWINAGCDVGLGLPKCGAMHPTSIPGHTQKSLSAEPMSGLAPRPDMHAQAVGHRYTSLRLGVDRPVIPASSVH
jgi:hypothetical protein